MKVEQKLNWGIDMNIRMMLLMTLILVLMFFLNKAFAGTTIVINNNIAPQGGYYGGGYYNGYYGPGIMCTSGGGFCTNGAYIMSSSRVRYAPSRWKTPTIREKRLSYERNRYYSYRY